MTNLYEHGYALIIGVDQQKSPDVRPLPDVKNDIEAICGVFTDPERCAYPPEQVRVLLGEEATKDAILDGLEWLQEQVEQDNNATAVVYYSGHGWHSGQGESAQYYLIPYDTRVKNREPQTTTALSALDFNQEVASLSPKRLLVVLDCCHAAGMETKDAIQDAEPEGFQAIPASLFLPDGKSIDEDFSDDGKGLEALTDAEGRAVLSSCKASEKSYLRSDGKMSHFTYHLIEALTGHAQPKGGANEVLVSDILGYVHRQVPESAQAEGKIQHPQSRLDGVFPVALLLGGKGLADGASAPDPIAEPPAAPQGSVVRNVDTGGGAYVEGDVNTGGGDFVGRDANINKGILTGDRVASDKKVFDQRGQQVGTQYNG